MSDNTAIEWAHAGLGRGASWNPVRARDRKTGKIGWHCVHASEGCRFCYSERLNKRLGTGLDYKPTANVEIFLDEKTLLQPLRWKAPRGIFVGSMTDAFGDFVTDEMVDQMFAVAALCPQHRFLFLTKRPPRMRQYLSAARAHPVGLEAFGIELDEHARDARSEVGAGCILQGDIVHLKLWPLPNVWLGTSVEDQQTANARIPDLLATPAAIRFVSFEPALESVNFNNILPCGSYEIDALRGFDFDQGTACERLDWIIVGGESGPAARQAHPDWFRFTRDRCASAGVAFFMKQMTRKAPIPADLLVRQFPGQKV